MERAKALEVLARFGQGKISGHDIDDVDPILDLPDDVLRDESLAHWGSRARPAADRRASTALAEREGLDHGLR